MSRLLQQFILRYNVAGHLRFDIPEIFAQQENAQALEEAVRGLYGVYRVRVDSRHQKLSIRYHSVHTDVATLASALMQCLDDFSRQQRSAKILVKKTALVQKGLFAWFEQRYRDAKETLEAAKIVTQALNKKNGLIKNPEQALINFFNDILALFLIRMHWDLIVKLWLPNPIKYRHEWADIF